MITRLPKITYPPLTTIITTLLATDLQNLIQNMSDSQEEMKIDPSRAQALVSQLNSVKDRIAAVANGRNVCMTLTLAFKHQ
jgi:hypothetical protein